MRLWRVFALLLLLAQPAAAQVAFDAGSEHQNNNDGDATWAHTVSGSDRYLMAGCAYSDALTFTTATYNGDSMGTPIIDSRSTSRRLVVWALVAPDTGTNNVSIAWSDGNREPVCAAMSYTGVDQASPIGTVAEADGFGTTGTVVTSSASGNMVADWLVNNGGITGWTVGAGQTQIQQEVSASAGHNLATSYEAGGASVTMSWTWTGGVSWRHFAVPINASSGGPAPSAVKRCMLLGVCE